MTSKQKKLLIRIILAGALLVVASLVKKEIEIGVSIICLMFAVPFLVVGYDVVCSAIRNIVRGNVFDEKFLMTVATIGAFGTGEFAEAVAVMLFYQIGELFESIAVGKSRKSIASLLEIKPEKATVIRDEEVTVSPQEVLSGEVIIIRPGERIPLDGVILEGSTDVNTAALTGESAPRSLDAGDKVISGSINLTGVMKVRVSGVYEESTVAKMLELVTESVEKKAVAENFITRFSRVYTPIVVVSAIVLAIMPPLIIQGGLEVWKIWFSRALIFLVVSCPCALVVSVPLSFFSGLGAASRKGILIKGSNYLEALSKVDTFVFDKTGTLTQGKFAVDAIHPSTISSDDLLDIAAACESQSIHPVAESIIDAHKGHINSERIGSITEIAGHGIIGVIDGRTFAVGNGKMMDKHAAKWHECHLDGTVIHVCELFENHDAEYLGHIVINDVVKGDSAKAISELKRIGMSTFMLSGDSEKVALNIAQSVGVDKYFAELLPEQKVTKVEEILATGAHVAFVGDGINDAPVLARSDVGISMGALGSDAAIESSDVVLMNDKPYDIVTAVSISRKTMRIVRENIIFALAVKAIILILGALGLANMWIAVFGDVGVLIIAVINAMRALRVNDISSRK